MTPIQLQMICMNKNVKNAKIIMNLIDIYINIKNHPTGGSNPRPPA